MESKQRESIKGNPINPTHYNRLSPEPKDVIRRWGLNFNLGNAVKYVARAGHKGDMIEDLKKAQQYIQFEIDALEAERKEQKEQEARKEPPTYPNCKCTMHPVFAEMENGEGVSCGVLEMEVPKGTPPEEIIQMAIKKIYGVEE